jgi:hypothetical protein
VRELDWRFAVTINHHQELVDALRAVHRQRHVARLRRGEAVAQQVRRAGIDLRRRYDARQATGWMCCGFVDQRQRRFETATPSGLVPAVFQSPAVLQMPACRRIGRCQEHAQPTLRRNVDPALVDARQISDAGDAGQQHLAERHLLASPACERVGLQRDRALVEAAHIHGGDAVFLAHAAIERFGARVRVQIDQAGHHHQVGAVYRHVRRAIVVRTNESQRVAGEGDVSAHQAGMAPVRCIPGDDAGGIANAGRRCHDVLHAMAAARLCGVPAYVHRRKQRCRERRTSCGSCAISFGSTI